MPNLVFALDDTFDQADRISALLALPEVERDLHPAPPAAGARPTTMPADRGLNGWLVIDKPQGLTSNRVVERVRRATGAKAGHAGTLDPLATGVLPIALGEATKTIAYAMDGRKCYRFRIRWGVARDTDDSDGEIVGESDGAAGAGRDRGDAAALYRCRSCRPRRSIPRSRSPGAAPMRWPAPTARRR